MVVDYSKAVDEMEWHFIFNGLKLFNSSNNFISMVELLRYKIKKRLF